MKDKILVYGLGIGILLAVIGTLIFYGLGASLNGLDLPEYMIISPVIILVLLATWTLKDRIRSVRSGLPIKDEMSKKFEHKAGYYAWLATIWICLGLSWANEILVEDFGFSGLIARHMAFAILLLSALTFFILWFWFRRRGDV